MGDIHGALSAADEGKADGTMQPTSARGAGKKKGSQQAPDPRFAALVRLLARDLARQHFENPLSVSPERAYPEGSPLEDDTP